MARRSPDLLDLEREDRIKEVEARRARLARATSHHPANRRRLEADTVLALRLEVAGRA